MAKGYQGQSCQEEIYDFVSKAVGPVTYSEIHRAISSKGDWKDHTVWRILMSVIVNLVPARHEWENSHPFLFLRPDGRFELYDKNKHPAVIE
jgi:hypothetical protein